MSKEFFWGCELNKTNREYTWDPDINIIDLSTSSNDGYENHALILKQALIGGTDSAVDGEINIVELETEGYLSSLKLPILRLKSGSVDHMPLDVYIPKCGILRLISGSGPVFITGQHIIEYGEDEEVIGNDNKSDMLGEEEEEEEVEEVEPEPIVEKGKRKSENGKSKPNKLAKLDVSDREEESSDSETPPKNVKKKPIAKGKAKIELPLKKSKK